MRPVVFFVGIGMVILGPLVTLSAFSSCLRTILSGNVFACVTDIVYFVLGGIIFVAGVITAIIGVFVPDPKPIPSSFSPVGAAGTQSAVHVICKKCAHAYDSNLFFCPSCGMRQG
jgi:hypothetical protein